MKFFLLFIKIAILYISFLFKSFATDTVLPIKTTQYIYAPTHILKNVGVDGDNRAVQGLAWDNYGSRFYVLQMHGSKENPYGIINRFSQSKRLNLTAQDAQLPTKIIGHQGISPSPWKEFTLLTTAGPDVKNFGLYITALYYSPDKESQHIKLIKVFPDKYSSINYAMPAISPTKKKLLALGRKEGKRIARVYNLTLGKAPEDALYQSTSFIEWEISPSLTSGKNYPLQADALSEKRVYLLSGFISPKQYKKLYIYNINGSLINKLEIHLVSDEFKKFEPEGLSVNIKNNSIMILFNIERKDGYKMSYIYSVPLSTLESENNIYFK